MKTKKFLAIVALALPLVFVSCSSDDDDVDSTTGGTQQTDVSKFEVDGIYYNVLSNTEQTVEVTNKNGWASSSYSGTINIPETVEYNDKTYTVVRIGDFAFCEGSKIDEINMPNTITSIGVDAFYGCRFNDITLSSSLLYIEDYAFERSSIKEITLPNSVLSLGNGAFYYSSIMEIKLSESLTSIGDNAFQYSSLTNITLPNSLEYIGDYAFAGLVMNEINIPRNVNFIGKQAISSIKYYTVDEDNQVYSAVNGVLFSKDKKTLLVCPEYYDSSLLNNFILPEDTREIGDYAFYASWYLRDLTNILYNITTIGEYAFSYIVGSLGEVNVPNTVSYIGAHAFEHCYYIKRLNLSDNLTSIKEKTFYNCIDLQEITLGLSVTSIGESAFEACGDVEKITSLNPTPPSCEDYAFLGVSKSSCTIYVPKGAKEAYASAATWQDFSNIVEME